jgi:hypothetical protein
MVPAAMLEEAAATIGRKNADLSPDVLGNETELESF